MVGKTIASFRRQIGSSEECHGNYSISEVNNACMLKLCWQAATSSSLWATFFKNMYFPNSTPLKPCTISLGSCTWKKMRKLSRYLQQSCQWIIGNGESISYWYEGWLNRPLLLQNSLIISSPWMTSCPASLLVLHGLSQTPFLLIFNSASLFHQSGLPTTSSAPVAQVV